MITLDEYQLAAATAPEPRVLVTAVPGSGKTRTLCARVEYLIKQKVRPSSICVVTFTRYAANELRERLVPLIGSDAGRIFIGTFHAFALRIITGYGHRLGWDAEYLTILDEEETSLEEAEVMRDLGMVDKSGKWNFKAGRVIWDQFKRHKITTHHIKTADPELIALCMTASISIKNRLRAENTLTYDMIIEEADTLLKDSPEILNDMRELCAHVLVDEFQDTDSAQMAIIDRIDPPNRYFVGDIDQSIYGFRGAMPRIMLDYSETAKCYSLPNSYRFGVTIGDPANKLIKHNSDRLDTAINAIAENRGTVNVVKNSRFEAIADLILAQLHDGYAPDNICILARRHSTLEALQEVMASREYPFLKIGGQTAIDKTAEFRVCRGYLRAAVNPCDKRALMAISTVEGISESALIDLRAQAAESDKPIMALYAKKDMPDTVETLRPYLQAAAPDVDWTPSLQYLDRIQKAENFKDTGELVRYLGISDQQDNMRESAGKVTLCTIHAAKGLEWPVVFLIGMNSAQFPSPRSRRDGELTEERKLCYVGMTRAEEILYLVNNMPDTPKDEASQFFEEMGFNTPDPEGQQDFWDGDNLEGV